MKLRLYEVDAGVRKRPVYASERCTALSGARFLANEKGLAVTVTKVTITSKYELVRLINGDRYDAERELVLELTPSVLPGAVA